MKLLLVLLIVLFFSSCEKKRKGNFSTYYIEEAQHEIFFYEHFIYLDTVLAKKDSVNVLKAVLKYVDTVKDGRPISSVSIINESFPKIPDKIDWPSVTKNVIFHVHFSEDSLKKDKIYIERVSFQWTH